MSADTPAPLVSALTDERLEEIRQTLDFHRLPGWWIDNAASDLLREVDRLRAAAAVAPLPEPEIRWAVRDMRPGGQDYPYRSRESAQAVADRDPNYVVMSQELTRVWAHGPWVPVVEKQEQES